MPLKFEGMDDLLSKLSQLEHPEFAKERALDVGAEHMRQKIAESVPRGSGSDHAADHIIVKKENGTREIGPDHGYWYLKFPEFGTSTQPAQGFMAKTFHAEIKTTQNKMADSIRKDLGL
ncbi:HK97-gp10 family putative phage morphogenesis protein [Sporolactobacillus kofuensis]|uniref:HK97-gp10 family putative phage morphogenesis protein n=1 Tax=Sporolactobacillus kofuensis TaxID=269672 RepID=A0ABW1WC12_9BACL|nr:HK97-gp10 family putative phage morphogenesis protein [Sporolactobacillus kofuensis]MCO7175557.1 HK97 gp10 family phage protein [Sporolactobacillus kofuensis]